MNASRWTTARLDWQERIRSERSLLPDLPLIRSEAEAAVRAFSMLRLPDVVGQPELGSVAGEWQLDMVRAVFGSYDPTENKRHIREFFCMVSKKSGKTTCAAAMMLCAVLRNRRPRAEFLLIAPTLEVADLAFRQVVGMIESDPVLTAKFHIRDHLKTIVYRQTKAFLKVKSFDPQVVVGSKPCGVLVDELHAISQQHDADRVLGQLRGGLLANPEGFLIFITTQSERQPAGVFREMLHNARRVRDGELSLPLLPLIYEFPPDIDWRDAQNWRMVNPTPTITIDRLIPDYEAAVAAGEHELRRWASQHLNVEIGLGLRTDRWPGAEYWERQTDPRLTLDEVLDRSEVIICGMDGGGLDDLFGFAVLGRDKVGQDKTGKSWLLWSHAWCHKSVLERRQQIAPRLRGFQEAGELTICDDALGGVARRSGWSRIASFRNVAGSTPVASSRCSRCIISFGSRGSHLTLDGIIAADPGWATGSIPGAPQGALQARD